MVIFYMKEKRVYIRDVDKNLHKEIFIYGWIESVRNHGKIKFLHLKDYTGVLQIVFEEDLAVNENDVVKVIGIVQERPENQENDKITTGRYEMCVRDIEIISKSEVWPIDPTNTSETNKLKYRTLYLRKGGIEIIKERHRLIWEIRNFMVRNSFFEVQTPLLGANTPEGSRSFLVPSRLHNGKFYALPQSPQLYKQLLMYSMLEAYFQIAVCLRDEDSRRDRLYAGHYQLDVERAFTTPEELRVLIKTLVLEIFPKFNDKKIVFEEMTYKESFEKYGTDKPDLRYNLCIYDATEMFKNSSFKIFLDAIKANKVVKSVYINKDLTIKEKDEIVNYAKENGFNTGYITVTVDRNYTGPISKFVTKEQLDALPVGTMFFVADNKEKALKNSHLLIKECYKFYKPENAFRFVFINDFPMFELDDEGKWDFAHNPFSMPKNFDENNIENTIANQFDLVCNGYELLSGAQRNTDIKLLKKCFGVCGYTPEEVEEKFVCLTTALKYGAPFHSGFGMGIERVLLLLLEEKYNIESIRDVEAFPLATSGICYLTGAPTPITIKQKKELGI
jgi:aspartyl-tRNA synthetase